MSPALISKPRRLARTIDEILNFEKPFDSNLILSTVLSLESGHIQYGTRAPTGRYRCSFIGDQLRLILPISGGHSSNLPMRLLCPSILQYPSAGDIRLLYLQVGAVRLLYPSAEDIRLLYLQVVAACPIDLQYCTKLGHPLRGKRFILILGI